MYRVSSQQLGRNDNDFNDFHTIKTLPSIFHSNSLPLHTSSASNPKNYKKNKTVRDIELKMVSSLKLQRSLSERKALPGSQTGSSLSLIPSSSTSLLSSFEDDKVATLCFNYPSNGDNSNDADNDSIDNYNEVSYITDNSRCNTHNSQLYFKPRSR